MSRGGVQAVLIPSILPCSIVVLSPTTPSLQCVSVVISHPSFLTGFKSFFL